MPSASSTPSTQPLLLAYIPVLHQGYRQWLSQHSEAEKLLVLGPDLIAEFDHLVRKDIRALPPELIVQSLQAWRLPFPVELVSKEKLQSLNSSETNIVAPNEDEVQAIINQHLDQAYVEYETIWLRWDRSQSKNQPDITTATEISQTEFDRQLMGQAIQQAGLSSDWWRQVGAVIVKNGQVLLAGYNHHVPHPQMPYVNGDPRGNFHKGEFIELSTAVHAEAGLIASAAKQGLSLVGSSMYVTTFPCPNCAKLIAYSGITTLYFQDGYALLDGESILASHGVKLIRVVEQTE